MTDKEPQSARNLVTEGAEVIPWAEATRRLSAADEYWLATVHPDGRPHVRPVLAVWVDGALHSSTSPNARKGRNLALAPLLAISITTDNLDLVVEGRAAMVKDDAKLRRVAEAYASKYEWLVEIRDCAFYAEGAPTAGPPPFEVYEVVPTVAFGFGTDETFAPRSTRWEF